MVSRRTEPVEITRSPELHARLQRAAGADPDERRALDEGEDLGDHDLDVVGADAGGHARDAQALVECRSRWRTRGGGGAARRCRSARRRGRPDPGRRGGGCSRPAHPGRARCGTAARRRGSRRGRPRSASARSLVRPRSSRRAAAPEDRGLIPRASSRSARRAAHGAVRDECGRRHAGTVRARPGRRPCRVPCDRRPGRATIRACGEAPGAPAMDRGADAGHEHRRARACRERQAARPHRGPRARSGPRRARQRTPRRARRADASAGPRRRAVGRPGWAAGSPRRGRRAGRRPRIRDDEHDLVAGPRRLPGRVERVAGPEQRRRGPPPRPRARRARSPCRRRGGCRRPRRPSRGRRRGPCRPTWSARSARSTSAVPRTAVAGSAVAAGRGVPPVAGPTCRGRARSAAPAGAARRAEHEVRGAAAGTTANRRSVAVGYGRLTIPVTVAAGPRSPRRPRSRCPASPVTGTRIAAGRSSACQRSPERWTSAIVPRTRTRRHSVAAPGATREVVDRRRPRAEDPDRVHAQARRAPRPADRRR